MLLNVYSTESKGKISIDSSTLNPLVHFHVNREEAFTKEELDSFGYVPVVETPVKKSKKVVVEEVVEVAETPVEEVV